MEVILFKNFSKRHNSTKRPNDSEGERRNITIKNNFLSDKSNVKCSYMNPTFFISGSDRWTYLKAWDCYYFIDNREFDINGAEYITCTMDVLATYKEYINNTSAFVTYSSSNYDVNVNDNRIAHKVSKSVMSEVQETIFSPTLSCYALSFVSAESRGVQTAILTSSQIRTVISNLIYAAQDVRLSLMELFSDAVGSLVSLRQIPVSEGHFNTASTNVVLGDFDTGVTGKWTSGRLADTVYVTIPWIYNDFRRSSEYTRFGLVLPFIGMVEIKSDSIIDCNTLEIRYSCAINTGVVNIKVNAFNNSGGTPIRTISTYSGIFGRQIPIGSGQIDGQGLLSGATLAMGSTSIGIAKGIGSALATTAGAAVSGGVGAGIAAIGAIGGIASAMIATNNHDYSIIGGFGGGFGEHIISQVELYTWANDCRTSPSELTELYGRPCMKVCKIGDLKGFVATEGFELDANIYADERNLVNNMMNIGVYLE